MKTVGRLQNASYDIFVEQATGDLRWEETPDRLSSQTRTGRDMWNPAAPPLELLQKWEMEQSPGVQGDNLQLHSAPWKQSIWPLAMQPKKPYGYKPYYGNSAKGGTRYPR